MKKIELFGFSIGKDLSRMTIDIINRRRRRKLREMKNKTQKRRENEDKCVKIDEER